MLMNESDLKYQQLKQYIGEKGKEGAVIAFSGGVDSSTLAAVCLEVLGEKVVAVTAKSPTYTPEELEEAKSTAKEMGIRHYVVETNELLDENFNRNPENRCYYCKKELLRQVQDVARSLGFKAVFEGTNYSDLSEHRPGYKAVIETENAFCPWVENKYAKEEIRVMAKNIGLKIQNKPSNACLASRISYHEEITAEKLDRIARAEKKIRKRTGVRQLRVRDHNGLARIEVAKDERKLFLKGEVLDEISSVLKKLGFKYVTLDLEGYRTGSMLLAAESKKSVPQDAK
jgi:uncharacterized protein